MSSGLLSRSVFLPSAESATALAARLAPHLAPGDVILLSGPIGAGKSHLARGIIQARLAALGRVEDVPSPTFTLVQVYELDGAEVWHADLYRLSGPDEIVETGLEDAFETAICLVEWPDRLDVMRPAGALDITLEVEGDGRRLTARGPTRWQPVLTQLEGTDEPA